jgi:hypothetical protein
MRIQRSWILCVLTIMALMIAVHRAHAQSYPYPYPGGAPAVGGYAAMPPQAPYGYQPVGYYDPTQGAAPQPLQPTPEGPTPDPMMSGMAMGQPCPACGGYGCEQCMGGCDDFDLHLLHWLLPYGAGGCGAQRWYDASAEFVSLRRDEIGQSTLFATDGVAGTPVLSSDQLDFANRPGARVSLAFQLGAGNNIESTWLGGFNWASHASVSSPNNQLFSIMSQYGTSPFLGFVDTDRSNYQQIAYSSELNSVEMNYRQHWVGPNVRVQGSWLAGVRYVELEEDFGYLTFAPANPGNMDYLVGTNNSLTGAQVGGDLWICIVPGLSIGSEAKVGIYGNHAVQRTTIAASSFVEPLIERETEDAVAFLGDFNVALLWRISQYWTFRTSYMFVYANQVALASDNFNAGPPFVAGQRTTFIDNSSDALFHGVTFGLEYMW